VDWRLQVELEQCVQRGGILRTDCLDEAVEEDGDGIGLCVCREHFLRLRNDGQTVTGYASLPSRNTAARSVSSYCKSRSGHDQADSRRN
jgi:hypothetical protein